MEARGLGSLENHSRNLPTGHEDVRWDTEIESEGSLERTEDDSGSSWFCSESALLFRLHVSKPVCRSFTEDNLCQGTSVHISGNVALGAQGRGFTGMVNSCCELRPWGKKTVEVGEEWGVGACSSFLQIWTNYFLLNLKSCGIENLFISKATPSPIHNVIFKLVHGGNWLIN